MRYFHLHSDIDKDLLDRIYSFCNQYGEDEWTISIYTGGGQTAIGKTIIHIINQRPDKVTLICHEAYSCGFEIFYKSKCKKILSETCKGMYHFSSAKMYIMSNGKPYDNEDKCMIKGWEDSDWQNKMAKEFLNKKEFKEFIKGEDVYLTFNRMKEIFPDAEVI